MRSASPFIAAGFALAVAGQAFAQANSPMSPGGAPPTGPTTSQPPAPAPSAEPSSPSTPTTPSTPSAQGSGAPASATAAGAAAAPATPPSYTVGESVKDNTGASIGTITGLSGSGANQMATIKMGDQSFQVQASRLGSADGAAEINMTKAQIAAMLKSSSAK